MTIERVQATWCRWDRKAMKNRISHPYVWIWTDPEGTERVYDTKREALEAEKSWS